MKAGTKNCSFLLQALERRDYEFQADHQYLSIHKI